MISRWTRYAAAAALTLGLVLGAPGPMVASAATTMTATTTLNVRSGPSTSAKIVGSLYRGQTVSAVTSADGWTKIAYNDTTAYVATRYLTKGGDLPEESKVDAGAVRTTTTDVNLRKGPGLSYAVIKVLADGSRVTTTGKTSKGYTEVVNGSSTGWISSQYLTAAKNGLPTVIGTRVTTAALDIHTTSGSDSKVVAEVKKGTKLSVTGATANGRAQIVYNKAVRWVTAKYLATAEATEPSVPSLPKVTGTRYATTTLNIRSSAEDDYTLIAEVPKGTKLSITGVEKNGRAQIVYEKAARWVTAKYLSKTKPSTGSTVGSEKGLKPNAIKVLRAVRERYPQITSIGGVRPDPIPDHPSGRALDIMIPNYKSASGKALGKEMSRWMQKNAKSMGINYVIWDQHIWNIQRDSEGWRYMANRGSDSANHKNHVHVTVFA